MAVPNRKSALGQLTVFDLPGATSFLDYLNVFNWETDTQVDDGAGIAKRYEDEFAVKEGDTLSATIEYAPAAAVKTNLDVSLFSIGGVAMLADLKDGVLTVENSIKDGSGIADRKEYPHLLKTRLTIESEFEINLTSGDGSGVTSANLVRLASAGTLANKLVAYDINAGGIIVTGNAIMTRAKHVLDMEELQRYMVTLKGKGTPAAASGQSLLVSALTGTGALGFAVTTGANVYSSNVNSNLVIERCTIPFKDASVIRMDFDFRVFGQPTVTAI
jgi:hypothetical protein